MEILAFASDYLVPFLVVLTILVFVHEMGHFLVARWNGVRVETFSIGFGPELIGWTDRRQTRWKISAVPLGGYVKFMGDADPTSQTDQDAVAAMSAEERAGCFAAKSLGQRAAVVAAGPGANFLLAWVLMAALFMTAGQPFTPARVDQVLPDSAAAEAGLRAGDEIIAIDGTRVERFEDMVRIIALNPGHPLDIRIRRDGAEQVLTATPRVMELEDRFGGRSQVGRLGVAYTGGKEVAVHDPLTALWRAADEGWNQVVATGRALGQIVTGVRPVDDLGGPIRIAQVSGVLWKDGIETVVWLIAILSINLGLVNLLPIPMLDGGHLLFYAYEAVRGRPPSPRMVDIGFRIGLAMVAGLFVLTTFIDLRRFDGVVEFFRGLLT